MTQFAHPDNPTDRLLSVAEYTRSFGADLRLRRRADSGDYHRVSRGQYFPRDHWDALRQEERYAVLVCAAAAARQSELVLSHESAAVLLGLPFLFGPPNEVHFIVSRAAGGRSKPGIRKHAVSIDPRDITVVNGLQVTTVARTVVDLAAVLDPQSAVTVADRALSVDRRGHLAALATKADLYEAWERMLPFRGSVRAGAVIDFASHLAGSANESASRVNIALNGFPEPVLQHPFIVDGAEVFVDFYFPDEDKVGEADGKVKYYDSVMRHGRTPEQVLWDEKLREDGVRRQVHGFTRWPFSISVSKVRLRTRLLEFGLPTTRPALRAW
ncbi:hypothetical protein E3O19_11675 [Cryobacterium algoritolerans]|uniref:Transcriptional regulator, AbiEi antitoxin, Type IV TA system n=1 Tax=Cryobacterium algoritolerans TaxID=1259184 RepID=A0A4R8WRT2_9MICO|nr:hypothetical protein [Cryobacterium algoritolerans]TFC13991.1 hypothetical protein E3O19_11675 [Cryobacterium algoritolerans]